MDRLTPEQIVQVCKDFGVELTVTADGGGRMRGPADRLPKPLLRVLKEWRRDAIVGHLLSGMPRRKQYLWRTGHTHTHMNGSPDVVPAGAWWWRWQGEAGWRPIEEACDVACVGAESVRRGDCLPPGEYVESTLSSARRPDSESGNLAGGQRVADHPVLFPVGGLHATSHPTCGGANHE